jgi:hypothetical protein
MNTGRTLSGRQQTILTKLRQTDPSTYDLSLAIDFAPEPSVRRDIFNLRRLGYDIRTVPEASGVSVYRLYSEPTR